MCRECITTIYTTTSNSASNNTSSSYEQEKITRNPLKSLVHANQWVQTTAVIAKPVIRDKQT